MGYVKGILHASFIVSDLDQSVVFYRDVLGLQLDSSRPDMAFPGAWFNIGDSVQQIHLLQLANPDPVEGRPEHGGRDRHVAFAVDELELLIKALEERNIAFTRSKSGRKALFCRDPDGNALEFIELF